MAAFQVLAATTALISVLVSAAVSIFTIRTNRLLAKQKSLTDIATGIMPRRLDAIEQVWSSLFELEIGGSVPATTLDSVVRSSIWLPVAVREAVLAEFLNPSDPSSISAVRDLVYAESGANLLDAVRVSVKELAVE